MQEPPIKYRVQSAGNLHHEGHEEHEVFYSRLFVCFVLFVVDKSRYP